MTGPTPVMAAGAMRAGVAGPACQERGRMPAPGADGRLRLSASDVANFLACPYLTRLDLGRLT